MTQQNDSEVRSCLYASNAGKPLMNLYIGKRNTVLIMGHTKNGVVHLVAKVLTVKHLNVIAVENGLLAIILKPMMAKDFVIIVLYLMNLEKKYEFLFRF
jgi:hypothetical protein